SVILVAPHVATLLATWTAGSPGGSPCHHSGVSDETINPTTPTRRRVSARLSAIAESATLAVDAKAKALKAAGRPVIGFGAGEPDFPTPQYIVEAAVAAAQDPVNHRYSPAKGLPALREAIAAKTLRDSGYEVSPDHVLVTNGGKQAVYQAFAAVVDPGDEVLLPSPYWTTYPEAIALAGGTPVEVFAGSDQDYLVTVEQLEAARTPRTKALLFCSPSNPTGAVYSPEQTAAIGRWAHEHGVWVVTDEIYEHLVYDDAVFTPMLRAVPELADTTIVLNGVAKTYTMTGWRVGWMVGPADVVKAATNLQSHLTSNVANVSQRAALAAVSGDLSAVETMRAAFDERRRTMVRMLRDIDGVEVPTPRGAFYAYPNVEGVLGRTIRGRTPQTSAELAALILDEVEVAVVPGEAFGPSGYLRLSYALGMDDLVAGTGRIQELLRCPHGAHAVRAPDSHPRLIPVLDTGRVPPPRRRPLTVRSRILATVVVLSALALAAAGGTAWALQLRQVDRDIQGALERTYAELVTLAETGVDPETGESFQETGRLLYTMMSREVPAPYEGMVAFARDDLRYRTQDIGVPLAQDPEFVDAVADTWTADGVVFDTIRTAQREYRYAGIPVQVGDSTPGSIVLAFDRGALRSAVGDTFRTYAIVAVASLALLAVVAWVLSGRLLRPLRTLRETAGQISDTDLSRRIPVDGDDDLSELARTFNDMLDRLDTAFRSQRRLLDDAGHELRTPITIVRGHLELMDPADPQDAADTRELALRELDRMHRLADDLVLLAKSEAPDF